MKIACKMWNDFTMSKCGTTSHIVQSYYGYFVSLLIAKDLPRGKQFLDINIIAQHETLNNAIERMKKYNLFM